MDIICGNTEITTGTKKPVASPFSGLFETRKNSSFSKDATALFRGGKGIQTVTSPLIILLLKKASCYISANQRAATLSISFYLRDKTHVFVEEH